MWSFSIRFESKLIPLAGDASHRAQLIRSSLLLCDPASRVARLERRPRRRGLWQRLFEQIAASGDVPHELMRLKSFNLLNAFSMRQRSL